MRSSLHAALDLLFPRVCPPCGAALPTGSPTPLCLDCLRAVGVPLPSGCPRCGAPSASMGPCRLCRSHPPAFHSAHALGLYLPDAGGNVLARVVQHLKYRNARSLAAPLAELLATRYPFPDGALVAPVPLHPSRLRARGYNQALLLARGLARRRRLPLAPRLLARIRATAEHAHLDAAARHRNVRAAFAVRHGRLLAGRTVVLIDDVLTTGATADACAGALRAAGAARVHVFTVGRTP